MRFTLAVLASNGTANLIRLLKRGGGTSYPGLVAQKIDPTILSKLNAQLKRGSVLVTGTNGKTTTTALIQTILKQSGLKVLYNKTGANMLAGIIVSFLRAADALGKIEHDAAVIETDEGVFPQLCQTIHPELVVVTNFFRDQLDRYGELDKTISYIRMGLSKLPKGTKVLLNADDPMVVGLSGIEGLKYFYFGLEDPEIAFQEMNQTAEGKYCPRCGTMLGYRHYYYSHMGDYRCPNCGFSRPKPTYFSDNIQLMGLNGSQFQLHDTDSKGIEISTGLPGLYNVYNILAANAAGDILGIDQKSRQTAIKGFQSVFGRMERVQVQDKQIIMALVKNPAGWNEVMRTLFQHHGKYHLLIALNDQIPDGTDVSWIWDADAEQLSAVSSSITGFTISGSRAYDMAVRLKYAGLDLKAEQVEMDISKAWEKALVDTVPSGILVVIPNYTAMLALQEVMANQGYVKPYWEDKK